jgi:zinc/manganese transport system substrate-binding protein
MKRLALVGLSLAVLPVASSSNQPVVKPRVVASFAVLHCFVANVAGQIAVVDSLVTGAVSPHDYQFSPQDMGKLQDADLLVILGLGLEPWSARVRRNGGPRIVEVTAGLKEHLIYGKAHDHRDRHGDDRHEPSTPNPHVWLDPRLAIACVSNVVAGLSSADAKHASTYASNGQAYIERLQTLDQKIATALQPFAGVAVLSYHDALPYFAKRYGLEVAAVVQPVPEVNPSPRRLSELREIVRTKRIKVLLVDANTSSPLAERIGKEFRIAVVPFDTIETGTPSTTAYEQAMQRNVEALTRVLR